MMAIEAGETLERVLCVAGPFANLCFTWQASVYDVSAVKCRAGDLADPEPGFLSEMDRSL